MSVTHVPLRQSGGRPVGLRLLGDDRLARMVASGNEAAFAVISERYRDALYRHCRGILNHHEDASDAVQNTLLNAYRALGTERRDLALRPWLYRIAHNESISLLRRRRPHEELAEAADVSRPGADVDAETHARLRQLVDDLQQLSARQRGTLVMREISGLPYAEIGAAFSISENAAKQTVHEAHTALHDLAEGRAMDCEVIRRTLSAGDRRLLRGRKMRSHLRSCGGCRSFQDSIDTRRRDLVALAPPLPVSLAAALLHSIFGGSGGAGGGGGGVLAGGGGGGGIAAGGGATATAGATATTATATATATAGIAAATAGAGATAGTGAGAGLLAAVTGGAAPILASAGVVKALVPAAVGLTVGAGALGLAAPTPVTNTVSKVERALVSTPDPRAEAAAPAPAAGAPSVALLQAPSSELPATPGTPMPAADAAPAHQVDVIAAPFSPAGPGRGHPIIESAKPTSPGLPVAETVLTPGADTPPLGAAPLRSEPKLDSDPEPRSAKPEPKSGEGASFESVTPTEAPSNPTSDPAIGKGVQAEKVEPAAPGPSAPTPGATETDPAPPAPSQPSRPSGADAPASSAPLAVDAPTAPSGPVDSAPSADAPST